MNKAYPVSTFVVASDSFVPTRTTDILETCTTNIRERERESQPNSWSGSWSLIVKLAEIGYNLLSYLWKLLDGVLKDISLEPQNRR